MPFIIHVPQNKIERNLGIADGKFIIPDNIDEFNDEIAKIFEVEE